MTLSVLSEADMIRINGNRHISANAVITRYEIIFTTRVLVSCFIFVLF